MNRNESTAKVISNPHETFCETIDGDMRFIRQYDEEQDHDDLSHLLNRFATLSCQMVPGFFPSGHKDHKTIEIKSTFALAAPSADDRIIIATDVTFPEYHASMPRRRHLFKIPETIDGYLSSRNFQLACAMFAFTKVETPSGHYIEPTKLDTMPVLKKK